MGKTIGTILVLWVLLGNFFPIVPFPAKNGGVRWMTFSGIKTVLDN